MELAITNLTRCYGDKVALAGFSATLTPGIYGLLGPNGAGKSTLMNILVGNLAYDEGSVTYDGIEINEMAERYRSRIGFMPQQQGIYDNFTALRFLYYMAALKDMSRKKADEEIPALLKKVGLYEERFKKLKTFSGGMKQRILIAQAMLNEPEVLILDEPTAGLDPSQRIAVRNLISEISLSRIVLIATHVVSDIAFIAKEILILHEGQLLRHADIPTLLGEVADKVYEIDAPEELLEELKAKYQVSNVSKVAEGLKIRILSDTAPGDYSFTRAVPGLEDVYLHLCGRGIEFRV